MTDQCTGNLYIVAAPSGGGKTSLVKKLVSSLGDIEISVSHTTRQPRPGEEEGVAYFFISQEAFNDMIKKNQFIEYARVFNHYYGTSIGQINDRLNAGIDVVLDIDWQGAAQIKQKFQEAVAIFIVPPSLDILEQRLLDRQQDNKKVVEHRMQQAQDEMSHYKEFDYLIVNDNFEKAALELKSIVVANRLRLSSQSKKLQKLLSFLLSAR